MISHIRYSLMPKPKIEGQISFSTLSYLLLLSADGLRLHHCPSAIPGRSLASNSESAFSPTISHTK